MSSESPSRTDVSGSESNDQSAVAEATQNLRDALQEERRDASGARDIALRRAEGLADKIESVLKKTA
ncbi:hypothetical protein [Halocalculus aciditolerans]|uniref:Uncharacterized protein n=1 Tax=Halocalculus aciditolerans TaxID=1383812 RepID=A0A830F6N5_9EURY|nr:hypothetical protein [Halocalculus aciditolerans]GGL59803.1 hypothetical protein GCM10009039_17520 [Halocalculus aciditolerans]